MAERLPGDDRTIELEGVRITSPGLAGFVEVHPPGSEGMRSAEEATDDLRRALAGTGMVEQLTVEIRDHREEPLPAAMGTRSTARGEPAVELEVPGPGSGRGQVLLATAEDGVVTWHLPDSVPPEDAPTRGEDRRTYLLPRQVVEAPAAPAHRGLMGAVGKKLFKVLSFRLIDPLLGKIADHYVGRWEETNRPHRLRTFTPDDYSLRADADADLDTLATGRALLFVHGTLSTTQAAFHRLPRKFVAEMHRRYEGRVFAFDHPTASVDPAENARAFLGAISDRRLALDVVTHSRGGLVTRVLAETPPFANLPPHDLAFGKVVFVATPNAGTPLADRAHMSDFIDTYTNILELIPGNVVVDTLEVAVTVLKQLAVGALGGLDGLVAQSPTGVFLAALNRGKKPGGVGYFAVASNFEPPKGSGLGRFARDLVTDRLFRPAGNDLVVPTDGVYSVSGAGGFPIAGPILYPTADGIDHSGFWNQQRTVDALEAWLTG